MTHLENLLSNVDFGWNMVAAMTILTVLSAMSVISSLACIVIAVYERKRGKSDDNKKFPYVECVMLVVSGLALASSVALQATARAYYTNNVVKSEKYTISLIQHDAQKYVATHDGTALIKHRVMTYDTKTVTYNEPDNVIRVVYYDEHSDKVVNTSNNMSPRQLAESSGFDTLYYIVKTKSTK